LSCDVSFRLVLNDYLHKPFGRLLIKGIVQVWLFISHH